MYPNVAGSSNATEWLASGVLVLALMTPAWASAAVQTPTLDTACLNSAAADVNLQLLALRLGDSMDVEPAIYCRLLRDLTVIRAADPRLATIPYRPKAEGRSIRVGFDPGTWSMVKEGTYRVWDQLNRQFGPVRIDRSLDGVAYIDLRVAHKLAPICARYAALPAVLYAQPKTLLGDSSTIFVTRDGPIWHYLFDEASGDCPAGCTVHKVNYYLVKGTARPEYVGSWDGSGAAIPDWISAYYRKYK
jgi:hypothetical protein